MQAVPLAALNGSMMSAFKPHTLSPSSAASSSTVYEISAAAPAVSPMEDLDEDKCSSHEGDSMEYNSRAAYYHSLDNEGSRGCSPNPNMPGSPKISTGNLTPVSASSKEDSSSSSSSEVLSALEDDVAESTMPSHLVAAGMCVPASSDTSATDLGTVSATHVKHWTYEDQFKQLYNLSPDPERKEFLDKLFNYMQSKGNPITRVPIMAKQPLDLYKLFKLVVERGGLVEVIKKKAWRNVAKELNLPASITSAAFTMRSQYVKYLYPYECETVQLSEPQELQMAIDSNKRDRRHSENMDFVAPQLGRGELECHSPVVTTTPQGVQLISSPTVAFPHGSLPPYSTGFLVAPGPGGTHMVASPQLVQMSSHVPGIPIVMPSPTGGLPTFQQTTAVQLPVSSCSSSSSSLSSSSVEDREDAQSHGSREPPDGPPPLKKTALEGKVTLPHSNGGSTNGRALHGAHPGGLIMTHTGNIVAGGAGPHLIQMGAHGQIPIVVPASSAQQSIKSPHPPHTFQINSRTEILKNENGSITATGFQSHPGSGNVIFAPHGSLAAPPPAQAMQSFLQMTRHPNIPGLVIPQHLATSSPTPLKDEGRRNSNAESDKQGALSQSTVLKLPVANISIESAGAKVEGGDQNGSDASLVMTLEINQVVYQGILFAKPPTASSPQR